MDQKDNNEITVKVTSSKEELIQILEKKGFLPGNSFSLDDYYFVPNDLDLKKMTTRDILSKAVIIRNIFENNVYIKKITYKIKEFNSNGEILNQKAINCNIDDIEQAKQLLTAIGYKQIMNIKEKDIVYYKEQLALAIKDIKNGDILIEVETEPNSEFDTIDKLKNVIKNLDIPIEPNQYFIKKAEIEFDKIRENISSTNHQ